MNVYIPASSPVHDALRVTVTEKDAMKHRFLFRKQAQNHLETIMELVDKLEDLTKFHPSDVQRNYIVNALKERIAMLEKHYQATAPQQMSFELPE